MNVTLRHLRAAVGVSKSGSFSAAAQALHISQPALSHAISELEGQLGLILFDRTSRSVKQTEVGKSFVEEARRLLVDFDRMLQEVGDIALSKRGRVVVSCITSVAGRVLPLALSRCALAYPQVAVTVQDNVAMQVLSAVQAGDADFGLTIQPAELPDSMQFEPLHKDPFYFVCPKTHRFAKKRQVTWKALQDEHLISLSTSSCTHHLLSEELARQEVSVAHCTLVYHLSTVHGMLEAGFGVAVLPKIALPVAGHPTLLSIPLVEPVLYRTIGVYRRRDRALSPAATAFLEVVREVLQDKSFKSEH